MSGSVETGARQAVTKNKSHKPEAELPGPARLNTFTVTFLIFAIAAVLSLPVVRGSGRDLDYFSNFVGFMQRFFPPDFSDWRPLLSAMVETFQMAMVATVVATVLSVPVAIASSGNIAPALVVRCARFSLVCIRSIPGLIWALLAVAVCGANPLAGVVGLSFYSIGYLGKFFSDAFESVDVGVADALRASGADRIQGFQYGIWPHAKPLIWSHTLWMLEYNIRSASIIGYVGAGGIGIWLQTYQELGQWDKFSAVLFCILGIVLILDFLGERIRKQFAPQ